MCLIPAKVDKKCIVHQKVKNLINTLELPSISSSSSTTPLESLQRGNWVKLICGASFEDVVDIRNLSLVYTLAGGNNKLFLMIIRIYLFGSIKSRKYMHERVLFLFLYRVFYCNVEQYISEIVVEKNIL